MTSGEERIQILEMVETGAITPEEGLKLLQAIEAPVEIAIPSVEEEPDVSGVGEPPAAPPRSAETRLKTRTVCNQFPASHPPYCLGFACIWAFYPQHGRNWIR